jgi:UTP--glucose-1-phosphate uridylyltransferase
MDYTAHEGQSSVSGKKVTKAVIAAAGFGTRFLPQTKAMPKEMLPLVDKPIIQHVVEELVEAGIRDIIIVTNYSKRSIEDHFDVPSGELTKVLENGGKAAILDDMRKISDMANFIYVRQKEPLGNAAPLVYSGHLLSDEPFIYTWADDFFTATPSRFKQMIEAYNKTGASIVSCKRVIDDIDYDRYGIVAGETDESGLIKMTTIVEKPGKEATPSDLASVSSYLFTQPVMEYVESVAANYDPAHGEELKIQDAMQLMIDDGFPYYALEIANSKYYDAGNKLEYMKTIVDFALERDDIGEEFRAFLRTKV